MTHLSTASTAASGQDNQANDAITKILEKVLNQTFEFYLATHHYHWNVEGAKFMTLHTLFEEHYQDAFAALDEIAERIRGLDSYVNPLQIQNLPAASTENNADARARNMIENLIMLNNTVVDVCKEGLTMLENYQDPVTEDLLIGRMTTHEKNLWILRSLIKE